jgi:hypothetical protein
MYKLLEALRQLPYTSRTAFIGALDANTLVMDGNYLGISLEYLNSSDQKELLQKFSDEQYRTLLAGSWELNRMLISLEDNPDMRMYLINKLDPKTFKLDGVSLALVLWQLDNSEKALLLRRFTPEQLRPILEKSYGILLIASALESAPDLQKLVLSGLKSNSNPFKPSEDSAADLFTLDAAKCHIQDAENIGLIQIIQEKILYLINMKRKNFMPKVMQDNIVSMSRDPRLFRASNVPVTAEDEVTFTPEELQEIQERRISLGASSGL